MTNRTQHPSGTLRIGCAGWTISREAAPAFETEGSHLERYARVLGTVEINSSFYRPHQAKTYARWAHSVPPAFRFAVKLPRTITHEARLSGIDAPLRQFAAEAGALGDKLGCLLVQLPPTLGFDAAVASDFFARLKDAFGCMVACEARHPSWFGDDASALLRRDTITRVIADPAKGQEGLHVPTTESIYVRLHGAPRIYYSSYPDDYLAQLARDMATHAAHGRDVWCIFDNTASGAALPNALDLRAALGLASPTPAPDPGLPA
ncbi:DUF72 domain-containing protein [Massilia sp. CCM 8695]|uniref:DUF72 domain-containing protein n=1 Tax=Massilia frigida TaxID=2609281 RepID=A0ABX0ND11_9BURK|nr:DUF72 domain-containing protein [Massilia frigida]NHZ80376.1 DUF72 domain-containing protein [Massilia frigida]